MDQTIFEILDYHGEGYKPLVDYGAWRVAVLRFLNDLRPDRIKTMERHTLTDEVFVLLCGKGVLILGGNEAGIGSISAQVMEPEKIYNVKRNTWHTVLLNRDASVLIVENKDTSVHNSEYSDLSPEICRSILEIAKETQIG
jgi:ureidoglycolate hydrolase